MNIKLIEKKREEKIEKLVPKENLEPLKVKEEPKIKTELTKEPDAVTVVDGPVGKILEFVETLPKGFVVTNIIKAPSTLRKNGPITSIVFVEKNTEFETVIVHSEDFTEAAKQANAEILKGSTVLHAFSSPVSSRKRGRVAFEIIIIMKKKV
jgi:hypothetical protein